MARFCLQRNQYGYPDGIGMRGYTVLQLVDGTTRNIHNAQKIVDILNGLHISDQQLIEEAPDDRPDKS